MRWLLRFSLVLVAFAISGCVSRGDLDEIKQNQKDMMAKIDKLAKAKPQAPARPQRPRGPDAKKVYSFPVGSSPAKGAKDALVTIIEVSDFQ